MRKKVCCMLLGKSQRVSTAKIDAAQQVPFVNERQYRNASEYAGIVEQELVVWRPV